MNSIYFIDFYTMSAVLGKRGVIIYENDLISKIGADEYIKFKKKFRKTVMLFNQMKTATIINTEIHNKKRILIIPRFMAFDLPFLTITNTINGGDIVNFGRFAATPYPIQILIRDHIMSNYFNAERAIMGRAGLTLELEAGLGKTYVAAMIAHEIGMKTLYIIPNEYLLEQGIEDFKKCLPDIKIGRYYGKKKCDGDVVFMIINSALHDEFILDGTKITAREFFARFGLSIWDEAHEYSTMSRVSAMRAINTKYMLGITAEANNREDKLDCIVHYNIGPVLCAENIPGFDVPMNDRFNGEVRIIKYAGQSEYTRNLISNTGMMSSFSMARQVMSDIYRIHLIVMNVKLLYDNGANFFIWCDMRDLVTLIKTILIKLNYFVAAPEDGDDVNDINAVAHLMGGTSKDEIKKAQNARIIIATYQYAYRGVSLPNFNAMIFATPRRAKIYQTLKRIFRLGGDVTISRKIIDIVDDRTKLKAQLSDRMKQYKRDIFNLNIKKEKINFADIEIPDEYIKIYKDAIREIL